MFCLIALRYHTQSIVKGLKSLLVHSKLMYGFMHGLPNPEDLCY